MAILNPKHLILLAIGVALASGAQARLISEHTEGMYRVCVYEKQSYATPTENQAWRVGLGQPCPFSYPGRFEDEEGRAGPTGSPPGAAGGRDEAVPSMAMLRGERRSGSQVQCVYTYLGRDYVRPGSVTRSCPLTPVLHWARPPESRR